MSLRGVGPEAALGGGTSTTYDASLDTVELRAPV